MQYTPWLKTVNFCKIQLKDSAAPPVGGWVEGGVNIDSHTVITVNRESFMCE